MGAQVGHDDASKQAADEERQVYAQLVEPFIEEVTNDDANVEG